MTADVVAVVLAAGESRRFGSTKQLAACGGLPLAARAVRSAAQAFDSRVVLTLGHDWQPVLRACAPPGGFVIVNERFADGLGSSIARSVTSVRHAADAIVLVLADQPCVPASHLRRLVNGWSGEPDEIVATAYAGTLGAPALFGPGAFDELARLTGDQGARALIASGRFRVVPVACEGAAVDIDSPSDLEKLERGQKPGDAAQP